MNNELQAKLLEILSSVQATAGTVVQQIPEVAQSYITYGRVITTVAVVGSLVLALAASFLFRKVLAETRKDTYQQNEFILVGIGITCFVSALCAVMLFGSNIQNFLLVWFAPKVWLLQALR